MTRVSNQVLNAGSKKASWAVRFRTVLSQVTVSTQRSVSQLCIPLGFAVRNLGVDKVGY